MNDSTEVDEAPAKVPAPSPGALLRIARERSGHGLEDLAAQLKLSRGTLEALENDDFASLSEPVYVRGYYRKVAKALSVPEQDVLDAYNTLQPTAVTPIRTPEKPLPGGIETGMSRRGQGPGLLVAGLIVVASLGLLVYYANPERTESLSAPEPVPAPVVPPSPAPEPAAEPPAAEGDEAGVAAAPGAAPAAPPEPAAAEPEPEPAPPARGGEVPEFARNAKASALALHFNESSFVRIEDAAGRTLLIGLVRANEAPVLDGQPPYAVFLGNAPGVRVYHAGKEVEFADVINRQNQTARFTVP